MSYESPIKIIMENIQRQIDGEIENGIYKAVQNVEISVDKAELVRALRYDRHQYEKGYNDRDKELKNEMAEAEAWVMIPKLDKKGTGCLLDMRQIVLCKECKHWNEEDHDCNIKAGHFFAPPDWFCADGERR